MKGTIWQKEFAFSKAAFIRIAIGIALLLSVVLLVVVWVGLPPLLVTTKSLAGQHPQHPDPLALSVYIVGLALGLGIPFAFLVAVTTIRSRASGIRHARSKAKLILVLTSLVYINLLALPTFDVAFDVLPYLPATTWRLLPLMLGWVGIAVLEGWLVIRSRKWLERPRKPDSSQGKEHSPGITQRHWYRRGAGAAAVCAAFAFLAHSFFAVGAILLMMGIFLIVIPSPKRPTPTWLTC